MIPKKIDLLKDEFKGSTFESRMSHFNVLSELSHLSYEDCLAIETAKALIDKLKKENEIMLARLNRLEDMLDDERG
jgi:hypothetical protein